MLKSTHQTPLNSIVLVFSVTRLPVKLSILAMPLYKGRADVRNTILNALNLHFLLA